jgi:hypothetical protein
MIDQISLLIATPIAKIILDKLYEGAGSKLGEKVIELASAPIQKLGQTVWNRCFRGKPGTDKLLEAAAKGSDPELQQIRGYLLTEMEKSEFVDMVQPMASEIHQIILQAESKARNSQQILGGQGLQVNDPKSQVVQAGDNNNFTFNTYVKPDY